MLQVGKKYHYRYSRDVAQKTKYECIFADEHGALLRWPSRYSNTGTTTAWLDNKALTQYEEYREPVVHTRYIHVWKFYDGRLLFGNPIPEILSDAAKKQSDLEFLKVIEIKYVENK